MLQQHYGCLHPRCQLTPRYLSRRVTNLSKGRGEAMDDPRDVICDYRPTSQRREGITVKSLGSFTNLVPSSAAILNFLRFAA